MSRLKYFIRNRLNAKSSYFILLCIFSLLLVVVGTSFAIFTFTSSKSGALNIKTGSLVSSMTSVDLVNNRITVSTGETKIFHIELKNINSVPATLNLYYKGDPAIADGVVVGYNVDGDVAPTETGYVLNVGETKTIKVTIKNNSTSSQTIIFGSDAGLKSQTLNFPSGNFVLACEDDSLPNAPAMSDNLIPIKWVGSQWVKADINNTSNDWYNYNNQIWANAVTVTAAKRETYQSAAINTPVLETDILTYMVWIPRYKYQYTNLGTVYAGGTKAAPGEISVKFISGKNTIICNSDNYKMHPAFTFGEEELTGFWVGKFGTGYSGATSSTNAEQNVTTANKVIIKPNVYTWRNITVSKAFTVSTDMDESGNIYGYTNVADTHMMKNTEWGAVAYLSQSTYGKYGNSDYIGVNKELYKNDSSGYFTGKSCGGPAAVSGICSTSTANGTYSYSEDINGTGASTTGNIWGIYDMSGGTVELVMANYNDTVAGSEFDSTWFTSNSKYYDKITTTLNTTACLGGICYGHALSETAGWYNDYASFPYGNYAWFTRGAGFNGTTNVGVFYYASNTGAASSNSFRIVHK